MKETLRNKEVFEIYYSMGSDRSLAKLYQKYPNDMPKLVTLKSWSKAFNWQDRIELRDINNGKELEAKTDKAVVNSKADYRALIKKVVKEFEQKLKDKKIIISKPGDLAEMAKLDLLMMGEATEKGELILTDAKRKLIDKISRLASRTGEDKVSK